MQGDECMAGIISKCPTCGTDLQVASLRCTNCGLELKNDFELSPFDLLTPAQMDFLISFLTHRGNMSSVQSELNISYPTAKKRLDSLLESLNLTNGRPQITKDMEVVDMSKWFIPTDSTKASDIIKQKLKESGGRVIVYTATDLP